MIMIAEQGCSRSLKAGTAVRRRASSRKTRSRRALAASLLAGAGLLAWDLASNDAIAQSRGKSGITINTDVLDSLGPGPAPLPPLALPSAPSPAGAPTALTPAPLAPTPLAPTPLTSAPLAQPPQAAAPTPSLGAAPSFRTTTLGTPKSTGEPHMVTRPSTLLFPPLQAPSSSLTPGFSQEVGQQQRKQAFDNAFADGPEPRSQLLLPLANAPAAAPTEEGEWVFETVIIQSRPTPTPAPRKPAPTPAMLAALQASEQQEPGLQEALEQGPGAVAVTPVETTELPAGEQLAPEFQTQTKAEGYQPNPMPTADEAMPAPTPLAENAPAAVTDAPVTEALAETPAMSQAPAPEIKVTTTEVDSLPETPETREPSTMTVAENDTIDDSTAPLSLLPNNTEAPQAVAVARPPAETPETGSIAVAERADSDESMATASDAMPLQQTASLPQGPELHDLSFTFDADSAELTTAAQEALRMLADDLLDSGDDRIQVLGYAASENGSPDLDRQLALSRALKVRTFLIDAGIPSKRIQVRPTGNAAGTGPANRVDIKPVGS